jgi:dynein heavy chain
MLKDLQFLNSLKNYNKNNVSQEAISIIRNKYLTNPEFDPELIKLASSACEGTFFLLKKFY